MNFTTNVNWNFVPDAFARIERFKDKPPVCNFPAGAEWPVIGDCVAFAGWEGLIFVVVYREFQYLSSDSMNVHYELDVLLEKDRKRTLRLIT